MADIRENMRQISEQLQAAAHRVGRRPETVKLVAVSKKMPAGAVEEARQAGQFLFGESYIQEAEAKIQELAATDPDHRINWHFIGHLQSNKAKQAAQLFQMIETVDRFKLARELNKYLDRLNRTMDILIQVNIGREPQKSGVLPEHCAELLEQVAPLRQLRVRGLMAMPPFSNNPEDSRPYFRQLRKLAEAPALRSLFDPAKEPELSMGMSNDFTVAIEEGATLIRVGTAIFGSRP